jgi:iron complex transport system substrate-binding protein
LKSAAIGAVSAFIGVLALTASAAQITLVDDLGRKVEIAEPAKRVVTLAPFLTELAYSAGSGARLVGVSEYSDYPPQAKALPQVASSATVSLEQVAALHPDLVLAWRDTIRSTDLERFAALRIPVFVTQARSLADVPRLLESVARLTGGNATSASGAYRGKLEAARALRAGQPRIGVFLEVWHLPLTTIAGPHWMNEALELCNADNAFADLAGVAPVVSWETLYARDPAAIVGAGTDASEARFREHWEPRNTLTAVKKGWLVYVDPDTFVRPTVRLADGVMQLCEGLNRLR